MNFWMFFIGSLVGIAALVFIGFWVGLPPNLVALGGFILISAAVYIIATRFRDGDHEMRP